MRKIDFYNPPAKLRPAPFWAVNDRLAPEETARQMADMLDAGYSGGFFHSRCGLITEYMGEEWFQCIQAALDVVKEKDGYLWLYDEDLWSSGNAGGRVAGAKDEYRIAVLVPEYIPAGELPREDTADEGRLLAYSLCGRNGMWLGGAKSIGLDELESVAQEERLLIRRRYGAKTPWWSGESFANLLNPGAMKLFRELTHEKYKERLGAEFGKRIPGIFTDEPNVPAYFALPWWNGLPEKYNAETGRSFFDDLPFIYFDGGECRYIRLLVNRTINKQLVENYSRPVYEWCEANNMLATGHYNGEDTLYDQLQSHCGGVMAHYKYQHIPGIDHLARQIKGYHSNGEIPMLLTIKQVSSAARQLGRPLVLSEIFGVTRHTNTFEDFKWLGDFDMVLGANFFCPHVALYSLRGKRKRDYPPNLNYQQSYWEHMPKLNDYFARLAYATSRGKATPDALILHPVESAAASRRFGLVIESAVSGIEPNPAAKAPEGYLGPDISGVKDLDRLFRKSTEAVLNAGYDCDLGDESLLTELGSVEGNLLRVGEMTYPMVIVPPSDTWRPSTFALLREFAANGGRIVILSHLPAEIDCRAADAEWSSLLAYPSVSVVSVGTFEIQCAVDANTDADHRLRGEGGRPVSETYLQHRRDGEQDIYFIVNSSRDSSREYRLILKGKEPLSIWNAVDGSVRIARTRDVSDGIEYSFTLPPAGSTLLVHGPAESGVAPDEPRPILRDGECITLSDTWQFERSEANVLVLDRMSVSTDGGKTWSPEAMDPRVRARLAQHFGVQDALSWQPWVAVEKGIFGGKGGEVRLRYEFDCEAERIENAALIVEDIEKGQLRVNGIEVDLSNLGWHFDRAFGKVDIASLLKRGLNTVEFALQYDFLSEVEPAYLVGDFGVRIVDRIRGVVIDEPRALRTGSWTEQGYPFYSGSMTYRQRVDIPGDGKRSFLRLLNPSGTLYTVAVNGRDAGDILWRPWEIEITEHLTPGENEITVTVVSSRQNTFGPLHDREGEDNTYCAPAFFSVERLIRPELGIFPYGLLGGVELARIPGRALR